MNKNVTITTGKQTYLKPQTEALDLRIEPMFAGSDFDNGDSTITGDIDEMELEDGTAD